MLVKALKDFTHGAARMTTGGVLDVNDHEGRELIQLGLGVDVQGAKDKRSPFSSAPTVSPNGTASAASSSPAVRAQNKRGSKKSRKGKQPQLV